MERYFRDLKAQGLTEASVRQVRVMLHRACRLARKWSGGALANPIADTELPAWTLADRTEVRPPTVDEVVALLQAAADDVRFAVLLRLVAATGMRRGEVCALRWSDVDVAAGTVRIDESIVAAEGPRRNEASTLSTGESPTGVGAAEGPRRNEASTLSTGESPTGVGAAPPPLLPSQPTPAHLLPASAPPEPYQPRAHYRRTDFMGHTRLALEVRAPPDRPVEPRHDR